METHCPQQCIYVKLSKLTKKQYQLIDSLIQILNKAPRQTSKTREGSGRPLTKSERLTRK